MRRCVALLTVMICASALACAQSEASLREYFEGRTVTARLDLPTSKMGLDIYPDVVPALNNADYGKRLRQSGIGIRRNESVTITKIKVNPKSIELQLGESAPTITPEDSSPAVYVAADKTPRERKLEHDVEVEADPERKAAMQRELDDLRLQRSREDARLKAALAQMQTVRQESNRPNMANSGSRLNLVFPGGVPTRALGPEYVISTLKQWVDFDIEPPPPPSNLVDTASPPGLRKGMTEAEVLRILGDPVKREPDRMGDLRVEVLTFRRDGTTLEATMVEGVLVRFKQWSD